MMKSPLQRLLLSFVFLILSCRDTTQPVLPTRLELTSNITELTVGDSALLTIKVYAGDRAINWELEWISHPPNVVDVDIYGWARALSPGTAYVTARAASQFLMFQIRVVPHSTVEPTPPPPPLDTIFKHPAFDTAQSVISGGLGNICALSGTTAYCWGSNVLRRLGVADTAFGVTRPSPLNGNFQFRSLHLGG